jgi:hypothetical protein
MFASGPCSESEASRFVGGVYLRSNVAGTARFTPPIRTQTVNVPGPRRLETSRL